MANLVNSNACFGIYPADIIVRTAILKAFDELRKQPWLMDFAFQALLADELTVLEYGAEELDRFKTWFLDNEIKVTLGYKINNISIPHIAIWLGEEGESDLSTGDTNDMPNETIEWVVATTPLMTFTAKAYDRSTGTITLPDDKNTNAIFIGMRLVDRVNGRAHEITDIIDEQRFAIAKETELNLNNAQIANSDAMWRVNIESQVNRVTFNMDCVVQGDSVKCIVLHALLRWCLQRGKQRLLEGRGFERSTLQSSGILIAADGPNAAQVMFKRTLTLTGHCKEYWPKDIVAPTQGIQPGLQIASGAEQGDIDSLEETQGWSTIDEDEAVLGE